MGDPVDPNSTHAELPSDDVPPVLGTWRNMYAVLIAELVLLVIVFYALARWAS